MKRLKLSVTGSVVVDEDEVELVSRLLGTESSTEIQRHMSNQVDHVKHGSHHVHTPLNGPFNDSPGKHV